MTEEWPGGAGSTPADVATVDDRRGDLREGVVALAPLLPSMVTVGVAFALVCRDVGLSGAETQLLSLLLFAGAAQFAFADLIGEGAGVLAITATILLINLRHVLYGLAANRWLRGGPRPPRAVLAFFLVDESYGLAEARAQRGRPSGWFLVGAGAGLYAVWNLSTLAGILAGELLRIPDDAGLDLVFPLSFVALTLPLIRSPRHIAAVVVAAGTTVGVAQVANGGATVLAASLGAVAVGAVLERGRG